MVFESSEAEVCFGEEVAAAACGVEDLEGGDVCLELLEGSGAGAGVGDELCGVELGVEVVEEEWVDESVYVAYAGVVHAAGASCLWVECAFE